MNNQLDAINNINIIKSTIEDSKTHSNGMYLLCFMLGIYHSILFLILFISIFNPQVIEFYIIVNPILSLTIFLGYFLNYKKENLSTNKYYQTVLSTWGLIVVAIPIMKVIIDLFTHFFFIESIGENALFIVLSFSDVLLFTLLLITYFHIIGKKFLLPFAMLLLFLYLLTISCFSDCGIPLSVSSGNEIILNCSSLFNFIVLGIGYIFLGISIKRRQKLL